MAQVQAARLNLRMQKELKLLLTDPPPGASFPSLSSSSSPSLSSIDAQIEGPEGTVYAVGVFKLKIQIPDRYPFQPPMVTFATPIYHPNIDNGGRICLDILNLPPKGAWQPSLNISTVLTSIGLLLSEPNPDDGLMHEASQEYKYNRQAFDQKARSLTEKYARIGASQVSSSGQSSQNVMKPSIQLAELNEGMDTSVKEDRGDEYEVSCKRLCGISRKLSLESSELDHKSIKGKGVNQVPSIHIYEKQMEIKGLEQDPVSTYNDYNRTHQEPQRTRKKLSLESSLPLHVKHDNHMIGMVSNECSSTSGSKSLIQKGVNQVPSIHIYEKQMEIKGLEQDPVSTYNDYNRTHQEPQRMRKKLSLESSLPLHVKHDNHMIGMVSNECSSTSGSKSLISSSLKSVSLEQPDLYSQIKDKDDDGISESNNTETKLEKKELVEPFDSNQGNGGDDEKLQQSDIQFNSHDSHKSFPLVQTIRHDGIAQCGQIVNGDRNDFTRIKRRKLGLAGRKSALYKSSLYESQQKDNIENLVPNSSLHIAQPSKNHNITSSLSAASESIRPLERSVENHATYLSNNMSRTVQRQPLKHLGDSSISINRWFQKQSQIPSKIPSQQAESCYDEKKQPEQPRQDCREKFSMEMNKLEVTSPLCDTDSVIVLDSEDSDEEEGRVARSRLSLPRRRLLGKSKP